MSLCPRCRNSLNFTRATGETRFFCQADGDTRPVPGDIVRCSDFEDRALQTKYDFEEIAWMLKTDKSGRVTGFAPPTNDSN